jgi:flagellar motility protein MotE (MotC chaperone)
MPTRPRRAAAWSPSQARRRPWVPVVLMAALGILTLAKLGLLAEGLLSLVPAAPAVDGAPAAPMAGVDAESPPAAPMPAAGPGAVAPPLGPQPGAAPTTGSEKAAPAPAQGFDPSRLTASEVAVLQQLAARRTALDQRAHELDRRQALLETAASALEGQIAQLSQLRDQITSAVEQHDAAEEAKLKSLIKIYEAMKAKAAAEIFNRLEMPVLLRVVEGMRELKSADVLARMDPVRARQVTIELARRTKLLGTAGAPAGS